MEKQDIKKEEQKKQNKKETKRKKKNKKIIVFIIIVLILIAVVVLIVNKDNKKVEDKKEDSYIEETEDGIKVNKSSKLNEAKLVNGLLISNIQLTEKDGMTTLLADVTNKNEEKTGFKKLTIILLDENGNEISSMTAFISEIESGKTTQLNASTTSNYIKAYDFKVTED